MHLTECLSSSCGVALKAENDLILENALKMLADVSSWILKDT